MADTGLAGASQETTSAPKGMYREEEQDEGVARGHVRVKEAIAYDFVRMQVVMDDLTGKPTDMKKKIEKGRGPYFYQDMEDFLVFKENNPKARLETFGIQMLKSTAEKYINKPENMEQFARKDGEPTPEQTGLDWRRVAKELGIKMYQRTKEDVLADIAKQIVGGAK